MRNPASLPYFVWTGNQNKQIWSIKFARKRLYCFYRKDFLSCMYFRMTGEIVIVQNIFDKNFGNRPYGGGTCLDGPSYQVGWGAGPTRGPSRMRSIPEIFIKNILHSHHFPRSFLFFKDFTKIYIIKYSLSKLSKKWQRH